MKYILVIFFLINSICANEFDISLKEYNEKYGLVNPYKNTKSVKENYAEAIRLYTLSANKGHDGAQLNLGLMYYNGHGIVKNKEIAYEWWLKSSKKGNLNAKKSFNM